MSGFKFYRRPGFTKGMSVLWTRNRKKALAALKWAESKGYEARIIPSTTHSGKKPGSRIYRVWRWKGKRRS
jgi:hypothetical protein